RDQRHREPPRDARLIPVVDLDLQDPAAAQTFVEQADEVQALLQLCPAAADHELLRNRAHALDGGLVARDELEVRVRAPPDVGRAREVLEMRAEQALAETALQQAFYRVRFVAIDASGPRISRSAGRRIRFGH